MERLRGMFRVGMIDDEPLLREGMKTIIDWESQGYVVCGEAKNGAEGIALIEEQQLDLAIVDIKMPDMDGFALVEEIRRRNSPCKIIFLTAHADFEFARRAIELSVEFYLLKPVDQDELIEKVGKIRETIDQHGKTQRIFEESILLSRDKFLEKAVRGHLALEQLEEYNRLYRFDFPWDSYRVALLSADPSLSIIDNQAFKTALVNELAMNKHGYYFEIGQNVGILLRPFSHAQLVAFWENIQRRITRLLGIDITVSVGIAVKSIDEVKQSYITARKQLDKKFIYSTKLILSDEGSMKSVEPALDESFDEAAMVEGIKQGIVRNHIEHLEQNINRISDLFVRKEYSEEVIKLRYVRLYTLMLNELVALYGQSTKDTLAQDGVPEAIGLATNLAALNGYMLNLFAAVARGLAVNNTESQIERIVNYVRQNYHEEINLEELAARFSYNKNYLGKLFTKSTGKRFNEYLDEVRMQQVIALLSQGSKVVDAAHKVGYRDLDYFYRKFRKLNGASPSEFKNRH